MRLTNTGAHKINWRIFFPSEQPELLKVRFESMSGTLDPKEAIVFDVTLDAVIEKENFEAVIEIGNCFFVEWSLADNSERKKHTRICMRRV